MEYVIPLLLTLLAFYYTIKLLKKLEKRVFKNIKYRQSDIHRILKPILFKTKEEKSKETQMNKMLEKNSINVMIVDNKAYWVFKNAFYIADYINGDVDSETAKIIDTNNMSKEDMEKMFFILDNLGGDKNERGSTGNN